MRSAISAIIHYISQFLKPNDKAVEDDLLLKFEEADKGLSATALVHKHNLKLVKYKPLRTPLKDKFSRKSVFSTHEVVRVKHHLIHKNKLPPLPVIEDIYENEAVNHDK